MSDGDGQAAVRGRTVLLVLPGLFAAAVLGYRTVQALGQLATAGGWTGFAAYLLGAVLVGLAVIAGVSLRARRRGPEAEVPGEARAVPVLAVVLLVSLVALPTAATSFSEVVGCLRGPGVEVTAELSSVESRRSLDDLRVGRYTVDGDTHTLKVREGSVQDREVGTDRFVVPWAGSDFACGTSRSSDAPYLLGYLLLGAAGGSLAVGAAAGIVRRRRKTASRSAASRERASTPTVSPGREPDPPPGASTSGTWPIGLCVSSPAVAGSHAGRTTCARSAERCGRPGWASGQGWASGSRCPARPGPGTGRRPEARRAPR